MYLWKDYLEATKQSRGITLDRWNSGHTPEFSECSTVLCRPNKQATDQMQNIFIQIAKCICLNCKLYF